MVVSQHITAKEIEETPFPAVVVAGLVNQMRRFFYPADTAVMLSIRRVEEFVHFRMTLPDPSVGATSSEQP